ncbi:MAG TPA: hypothetical protein VMM12_16940 [Longimicrobiales bacterium]|nr:hypothetical protein [Longimicrobiales bacterium]
MSRVRAFFVEEGTECLTTARAEIGRVAPDRAVVYRAIRRLRGSAQVARFGGLAREAARVEERVRPAADDGGWSPELTAFAEAALAGLHAALEAVRAGEVEPMEEMKATMDGEATVGGVGGAVGVEELEYRGPAALERALELRSAIEDAVVGDAPVGPLLDELFALIRLGLT